MFLRFVYIRCTDVPTAISFLPNAYINWTFQMGHSAQTAIENTVILVSYWYVYVVSKWTWWRHQMETFSTLLALCAGNIPVTGEFPTRWPVTWSFDVLFHLRLNKRLSKQSWGWWVETPSRSLWRHCNGFVTYVVDVDDVTLPCRHGPWHNI